MIAMEFKIQKTEYVNKTFRITKELNDKLSRIAQQENISVNELVVQCCNFAISNMKSSNKEKK
jgi:predicted HicB family RNase H-like nuclease